MNNSDGHTQIWPRNAAQGRHCLQESFVLPKKNKTNPAMPHENCHLEHELKVSPLKFVCCLWQELVRTIELQIHGDFPARRLAARGGGKFEDRIGEQMYKCTIGGQQKGATHRRL